MNQRRWNGGNAFAGSPHDLAVSDVALTIRLEAEPSF